MSILENVEESLRPVLPKFFENLAGDLEDIEDAFQAGEFEEVQRIAHGIKGSSGSFGIDLIQEKAKTLEEAMKQGEEEVQDLIDDLVSAVEEAREEL